MNRKHTADTLFVVLLYGLFALLSLLLILIGARVYKRTVEHTEARGDVRASLSYVANKVGAADRVSLETRDGLSVLVLTQEFDGDLFETCIYYTGGVLREWFAEVATPFLPKRGKPSPLSLPFPSREEDGLLAVTSAGRDGQPHTLHIALCRE